MLSSTSLLDAYNRFSGILFFVRPNRFHFRCRRTLISGTVPRKLFRADNLRLMFPNEGHSFKRRRESSLQILTNRGDCVMRGYFILFLLAFNSGTLQAQSGNIGKSQANTIPATLSSESGALPKKASGDKTHPAASPNSAVRPEDAVITLRGVCADANKEKDETCGTAVLFHARWPLLQPQQCCNRSLSLGPRHDYK